MKDIIALGDGFYELEGDYRWTKDAFNLHIIDPSIDTIFITVVCNKLFDDYNLFISTNNWKTSRKHNLSDGKNIINIPLNKSKAVEFKSSCFTPSEMGMSQDSRILGIQITKFIVKFGNNLIEIPITDVKMKSDMWVDADYELNESIKNITLGTGWHELEGNKLRWTNGNGELLINSNKYNSLKLKIFSRQNQVLKILIDGFKEITKRLYTGFSEVIVDVDDVKKINLITDTFSPKDVDINSKDGRNLGIMLIEITGISALNSKDIPIKNIFFDHDIPQLINFTKKYDFKDKNIKTIGGFGDIIIDKLTDVKGGKLNLNNNVVFFSHRSGWSFVMNALLKYHNKDGIRFEGFLEKPFIWGRKSLIEEGILPFKCSWIGVLHNPWNFPTENNEHVTSEDLVKSTIFQKSLNTCKGLYVLSKDLMKHVKENVDVPVNFLYHPTEFVEEKKMFSIKEFKDNGNKKILEVGSWLRKINSLFLLNADKSKWSKIKVIPSLLNFEKMINQIKKEREKYGLIVTKSMQDSVKNIQPLTDDEYDEFLTKNIVFIDLYASSANNAIIECMARGTPILINPLPSIVEYLGDEYPFYFNTIDEASEKVNNLDLIEETNKYLLECPTRKLITKENFLKDFERSSIFKNL